MNELANQGSLKTGGPAPFCVGMRQDKSFYSSEAQAGRPAIVILAGPLAPEALGPLLSAFGARLDAFSGLESDVMVMVDGEAECALAYDALPCDGPALVYCLKDYFARCGFAGDRPWIVLVDRNQRIVEQIDPGADGNCVASALAGLAALAREDPRHVWLPAPVLSVPNIFSAAFCAALIARFESTSPAIGGMAGVDRAGNPVHKVDRGKKHRQDCILDPSDRLYGSAVDALSRCCLPEMKKAFQFKASHLDRILIARYDDTGGYFRRHRDNVAAAVAYRQFAISVNLSDAYDGGCLMFPEFNGHLYKPGTGSGLIFSASLLHEATPVTKGNRYVLLTFIHDAAAEALRLEDLQTGAAKAA